MELMDESLTSFLERPDNPPPLPFHIQVNFSLDVAQALAYLHSNEVLHRDLSSNNVLLIGSSRAKVMDFGMAKLAGNHPRLTFCPGMMGYMSPEALQEPPAYTTKLDIFSCGVLHIQIITRKFPDPGPRMQQFEVSDPRAPLGRVEVPVSERERRRSHINLIDPTHPLLRIALDCLKDKEGERPSAEQLCSHLAALKETPRYQESLQQAQQAAQSLHEGTEAQPEPQRELLQQNQELRQQLEEREETLQAKEREVDGLMRSMEQLRLQSQEKEAQIQQKERNNHHLRDEIQQLRHDNNRLQDGVHQMNEQVQQLRQELLQTGRDSEQLIATLLEQKDEVIRSKDAALQEKERQIQELWQSQGDKRGSSTASLPFGLQEQETDGLMREEETPISQKERDNSRLQDEVHWKDEQVQQLIHEFHQANQEKEKLVATLQDSLEEKDGVIRSKDAALQEKERQIRELQQSQGDQRGSGMVAQPLRLQWRSGSRAPLKTFGESSAVHYLLLVAYFYSWDKRKIMMYNSETGEWVILPDCPKREFSIAVVNGLLTAIGGRQSSDCKNTKTLLSITEQQEWTEQFPEMIFYHNLPAVACTSTSLIVAGGWDSQVEVMDTNTFCWSTVASLPHPWKQATATICGGRIYMAGGFVNDHKTNSVLMCAVSELLSTITQCPSLGASLTAASGLQPSTDGHKVWQEVTPLPVYHSSLVTLHGQLLAVGGCDSDRNPTSAAYQYDTATNSWKVISHMSTEREHCFTAIFPDNTLLVAGGVEKTGSYSDSVEIAFCM